MCLGWNACHKRLTSPDRVVDIERESTMKKNSSNILLRFLGTLFLVAAIMKAHELLTVPVANQDIWSYRPFLIFQVECELALGILLLSGLFKRLAWMATLACFGLFCCVTLYKGLTGAASCGCFGRVHVDPWITLFAVDLPVVGLLLFFRPSHILRQLQCSWFQGLRLVRLLSRTVSSVWCIPGRPVHLSLILNRLSASVVSLRSVLTSIVIVLTMGITTPILAFNKPAPVTAEYTVLKPQTWQDKELPVLDHIDIGDQLRQGMWLVLLYHHDCPDCQDVMPEYKRIAQELGGDQGFLNVAFVELAPYEQDSSTDDRSCVWGRMLDVKQWLVTTPVVVLLTDAQVRQVWEKETVPDFEAVLAYL